MRSTTTIPSERNLPLVVLGATGRLGKMLCFGLIMDHLRVHCLQSRRAGPGLTQADPLTDTDSLVLAARGARVMIDLTGIVPTPDQPASVLDRNTDLACAALEIAGRAGLVHVFLPSSGAIYGRQPGPSAEDTPPSPVNAYGTAKWDMEQAVDRWCHAHPDGPGVTLLRIGNVAGADQLMSTATRGNVPQLCRFADGTSPRRSYIGPQAFARCLLALTRAAMSTHCPRRLNIAAPGAVGMDALLDAAQIPWIPRPATPDDLPVLTMNTALLQRLAPVSPGDSGATRIIADWQAWRSSPVKP